jgi:hypothetical protein
MDKLIKKLNYKRQQRIALINSDEIFAAALINELKSVKVDAAIDPRFLYDFMLIFVDSILLVEEFVPAALHNLSPDGILWFAFPKKTSKKFKSGPDRDHGWKSLSKFGFQRVRQVNIDDDYTALRFRNVRFIKSANISSE